MNWFGTDWGAPMCVPERHRPTPVGEQCIECEQPIRETDAGFSAVVHRARHEDDIWDRVIHYHRVCFMRTVIPCGMWSGEMLEDLPESWSAHRAEAHPELRS